MIQAKSGISRDQVHDLFATKPAIRRRSSIREPPSFKMKK
ncbi:hypothetical protein NBRC111894_4541 [Sporolactobacillus inulinus]|uniref:Uncharacterized protein n=1 Tax=Sporolactobacillus inulinus TaxID=2078 RepID=A0A4Y1ZIK6_9BACL|nr:hypothetical protein NBRC111894_4541 [Sporolactobacillus inulinus]